MARYLATPARDDVGRVRAVYAWITSLDPETVANSLDRPPKANTPLEYLVKIHMKMLNHAHLFAGLVR